MSEKDVSAEKRKKIGQLQEGRSEDFNIELNADDSGFGTFRLTFDQFNEFSKYDKDTNLCVILGKKNQNALFMCGPLHDFKKSDSFSLEENRGKVKNARTEQIIVGVPISAEIQFTSPSGKKLYHWIKRSKRGGNINNGDGTSADDSSIVDHVNTQRENMNCIMFPKFYNNDDSQIEVEWNHHLLSYKELEWREKLLVSQNTITEMLNYLILLNLRGERDTKYILNTKDPLLLSNLEQFFEYLKKGALNIFKEDFTNLTVQDYMEWKQEMLEAFCEKAGMLSELKKRKNRRRS